MSPVFRLLLGAALGSAAGTLVAFWLFPAPPPAAAIHTDRPPSPPTFPPSPEWERWLDEKVPLTPVLEADGFWTLVNFPDYRSGLEARRRLALEEGLRALSRPDLVAVLSDERFASLADPIEPWLRVTWTNLLLNAGLHEAMHTIDGLPSACLREELQTALLEKLVRTDPDAGFEWLRNRPYFHNPVADYLEILAGLDVSKATELWKRLDSASGLDFAGRRIVKTLMEKDWQSAIDWACANASAEARSQYVRSVFEELRPNQRDSGLAAANELSDPALRSHAHAGLLTARLRGRPMEAVLEEARALPAGSLDAEGWGALGRACASYKIRSPEPTAAAEQLRRLAAPLSDEARDAFLTNAAALLGVNDPPLASRLSEYLSPETIHLMAEKWANQNPTAASAWLTSLTASPQRDEAIAGFCRGIAPLDPSSAAEWAVTLQAGQLRDQTIREALENWRLTDPANAAAWAAAHTGIEAHRRD